MVPAMREWFNAHFTEEMYKGYLDELNAQHPGAIEFRIAETPIFVDKAFTDKMIGACESIVDVITQYNFKSLTAHAIPDESPQWLYASLFRELWQLTNKRQQPVRYWKMLETSLRPC